MEKIKQIWGKKWVRITTITIIAISILVSITIYLLPIYNPGLFDKEYTYLPVYNYKVSEVKSDKKVIQSITLELFDKVTTKDEVAENGEWTDISNQSLYSNSSLLKVTFTDGYEATYVLGDYKPIGNSVSGSMPQSRFQKLDQRFAGQSDQKDARTPLDYALRLYIGDTLYQEKVSPSVTSFQLKNPKTGKLQTYYQYGNTPDPTWKPIFFKIPKYDSEEEIQSFFDRYPTRKEDNDWNKQRETFNRYTLSHSSNSYYNLLYSQNFSNFPFKISTTGHQFNTRVVMNYMVETDDGAQKLTVNKTYDESNKADYITDILDKYTSSQ